jgi:hypothetical protein
MRLLFYISCFIGFAAISSCDYVTMPYPKSHGGGPVTSGNVRKVLLEDYTAAQCINCPRASLTADQLRANNPGKVITIGVHASSLESPVGAYGYDFRTIPGNLFDAFFVNADISGLPNGMINRIGYPTTTQLISYPNWQSTVATDLALPPSVLLTISNTYNTGTRTVGLSIKTKFLNAMASTYHLTVLLTEDSIVQPQKDIDSTQFTQNCVLHWMHRHVLRDAITTSGWGDQLAFMSPHTAFMAGDSVTNTYNYVIPANFASFTPTSSIPTLPCNDKHCSVVAFLYDDATKEVLQVEEVKVR